MQIQYSAKEVAELLYRATGEECACNMNDNDEWLPYLCDYSEDLCPNVSDYKCWEQYLKYLSKRNEVK